MNKFIITCPICNKKFTGAVDFLTHIQIFHKEIPSEKILEKSFMQKGFSVDKMNEHC